MLKVLTKVNSVAVSGRLYELNQKGVIIHNLKYFLKHFLTQFAKHFNKRQL
jgi:hypothetical protein